MAEISPIKYSSELQVQLFPDNSFYKKSVQETGIADTVDTVERPYQGSIGAAKTGQPASLPLQINIAEDGKDSYATTLVYAPPIAVDLPGEFALNYNKRQTKQQQQASIINTKCADIAATNWGPTNAAQILKTSGASRASNVLVPAGTAINNRKAVTKNDLVSVQNLLMRMNVSGMQGQYWGLVTPDFYSDLMKIAEFVDFEKTGQVTKIAEGIVGRILGMNIIVRSTEAAHVGLLYNSSYSKKALDAAVVATDCPAALFWNDKMVASAEGMLRTSINPNAPGYLGATIIESWVRFGAATARYDQKGVIALVEDNA